MVGRRSGTAERERRGRMIACAVGCGAGIGCVRPTAAGSRCGKRDSRERCGPAHVVSPEIWRTHEEANMPIILWLLGVPLSVVIILALIGVI